MVVFFLTDARQHGVDILHLLSFIYKLFSGPSTSPEVWCHLYFIKVLYLKTKSEQWKRRTFL